MLLHIPNVLTHDELRQARNCWPKRRGRRLILRRRQSALVKHNLQLAQTSPQAQALAAWRWRR